MIPRKQHNKSFKGKSSPYIPHICLQWRAWHWCAFCPPCLQTDPELSMMVRGFLGIQGPPCLHHPQAETLCMIHGTAPHVGSSSPAAGLPRQQGWTEQSHAPVLRNKTLLWYRCAHPAPTWPTPGLGPLSTLPGKCGCQGILTQCALGGVTDIWIAGKFTHPHQSAPASAKAALFLLFESKAKEQLEVNPAF